jgi:predicted DNA-binding mobile mystery protein A
MSVRQTVQRQYQALLDRAATQADGLRLPAEGWLRTARKALGMSGAQLARRLGVTRARVAHAEHAELSGAVTLKSMQVAAEAMGCKFVYVIVPSGSVEDLIIRQARKKATNLVRAAGSHMALEDQVLSKNRLDQEVIHLTRDLVHEMPPDFWDEK